MSDEPADSIDLEHPDYVSIGVTRGEYDLEIGRPRDYPDRADVSVQASERDRVLVTVDAMAGDHGTGHADVELTLEETRQLCARLDEVVDGLGDKR